MRTKQTDLDNILFAELERLDDESLEGEALDREIKRAKAIGNVAAQINASRANSEGEALDREIKRAKAIGNVAAQINASRANSLRAAQFMDAALDAHPKLPFEVK